MNEDKRYARMAGMIFLENDEWVNPLLESLVPENYLKELKKLPKTVYNRKDNQYSGIWPYIDWYISYCPICEREGYHSYLQNFRGVKTCPFHHKRLIKTETEYDFVFDITHEDETKGYPNVKHLPLPFERKVSNDRYRTDFIHYVSEYTIPIYTDYERQNMGSLSIYSQMLFANGPAPSERFHLAARHESLKTYLEHFVHLYNKKKVPRNLGDDASHQITLEHVRQFELELQCSARMYAFELMDQYGTEEYRKRYGRFVFFEVVFGTGWFDPKEEYLLRLTYVWQFMRTSKPEDAFSAYTLEHPSSGFISNYTGNNYNIEYDLGSQREKLHDLNEAEARQILSAIHKDYFFYMFEQYKSIAFKKGKIDGRLGWRRLTQPIYMVLKNGSGWDILRYNHDPIVKSGR